MLPYGIFFSDETILKVVAACDVMLAPWGWGAGITSFEALAVGLPVVTAPSKESVLHFTRGQVGGGYFSVACVAGVPFSSLSNCEGLARFYCE